MVSLAPSIAVVSTFAALISGLSSLLKVSFKLKVVRLRRASTQMWCFLRPSSKSKMA